MTSRGWLVGDLQDGLFPSQRTITIRDREGREIALVVTAKVIREEGGKGYVLVRIIDSAPGAYLVRLPGEVYGAKHSIVVNEAQLTEQPA